MDFKTIIEKPEYDFLRTNEHLKDKIMFLALGGSYAYGTNVEGSDIDIRGCAFNSRSDLIGLSSFNQVLDNATDTTIYGFNRLIHLVSECNPNTVELLGCKPEHYIYITPIGKEFIDNRKMFLSKKAINTFGGYSNQQLRRLENALARDKYPQEEKEKHILNSINFAMNTFRERYQEFEDGNIELYIGDSQKEDLDSEIFMNIHLKDYPLRDYKGMWSEMNSIVKEYGKLNGRNHKKDIPHLNKHICHLIRLYLTVFDILEKEEIITYREKDHDLLMGARNGYFLDSDGLVKKELYDMLNDFEKRLKYDGENTNLPKNPDYKKIEEFVMSVNERVVSGKLEKTLSDLKK